MMQTRYIDELANKIQIKNRELKQLFGYADLEDPRLMQIYQRFGPGNIIPGCTVVVVDPDSEKDIGTAMLVLENPLTEHTKEFVQNKLLRDADEDDMLVMSEQRAYIFSPDERTFRTASSREIRSLVEDMDESLRAHILSEYLPD